MMHITYEAVTVKLLCGSWHHSVLSDMPFFSVKSMKNGVIFN